MITKYIVALVRKIIACRRLFLIYVAALVSAASIVEQSPRGMNRQVNRNVDLLVKSKIVTLGLTDFQLHLADQ